MQSWSDTFRTAPLLSQSSSISGFLLPQYPNEMKHYLPELVSLIATNQIYVQVDMQQFSGLDSVADAVEYLHVCFLNRSALFSN
jgi:NADPH-dependent curcumin reductase CurA